MTMWLVGKRAKIKAHIWTGTDTLCRMWSTDGLKQSRYDVREDRGGHEVCHMCAEADPEMAKHSAAIKRANWAMMEDAICVAAHRLRMDAKRDLELAKGGDLLAAREAFENAKAEWRRVTDGVFDRVMASAGFPQSKQENRS